jgi:signal transduction histidine kinase
VDALQEQLQRIRHKVKVLNRLAEVSLILNSTLELEPLLEYLMDAATEIADAEGASVLLWDPKTHELRFAATPSEQSELNLVGQSVPLEGSIAGTVMLKNHIVQVDNVEENPDHYTKVDENAKFHTRSVLGVPMTSRERVIGVLEVVNKRALPWTEDDRDYLSVLAAQAAVAIESAQLVTALQKANQELSELDKLKNDFIAIASHELRTPLSIILGYSSVLKDETDPKVRDRAEKILSSGMRLRAIVDDLTSLRYMQQSQAELSREVVSTDTIIEDAAKEVSALMEAQGHKLEIRPAAEPILLNVDRVRIAMALTNMLNNAAHFTPPGGQIVVESHAHGSSEAWIVVRDNGIGIPKDQLERIFEKFYQIEDHMTRKHGGLGVGLSIVRAMADVHGGRAWADSPGPGEGATFTLALPLAHTESNG